MNGDGSKELRRKLSDTGKQLLRWSLDLDSQTHGDPFYNNNDDGEEEYYEESAPSRKPNTKKSNFNIEVIDITI